MSESTITINWAGKPLELTVARKKYASGGALAVILFSNIEPFAKVSVYLPGVSEHLPEDCFYFKTWEENAGILEKLEEADAIERVGPSVHLNEPSGLRAPLVKLKV